MIGDVNLYLNDADEPNTGEIEVIPWRFVHAWRCDLPLQYAWSDASLEAHVAWNSGTIDIACHHPTSRTDAAAATLCFGLCLSCTCCQVCQW